MDENTNTQREAHLSSDGQNTRCSQAEWRNLQLQSPFNLTPCLTQTARVEAVPSEKNKYQGRFAVSCALILAGRKAMARWLRFKPAPENSKRQYSFILHCTLDSLQHAVRHAWARRSNRHRGRGGWGRRRHLNTNPAQIQTPQHPGPHATKTKRPKQPQQNGKPREHMRRKFARALNCSSSADMA